MSKKNRKGMDVIVRNADVTAGQVLSINVQIGGAALTTIAQPAPASAPSSTSSARRNSGSSTSTRPQFDLPKGTRLFRCLAADHADGCFGTVIVPLVGGGTETVEHGLIAASSDPSMAFPGLTLSQAYNKVGLRSIPCAAANKPFLPASSVTCTKAMTDFAAKDTASTATAVPAVPASVVVPDITPVVPNPAQVQSAIDFVTQFATAASTDTSGIEDIPVEGTTEEV
jgi:hypothetical protein